MIKTSAFLVVLAIGLLVAGVVASSLLMVYVSIGVCAVAALILAAGVLTHWSEIFGPGEARPASTQRSWSVPQVQASAAGANTAGTSAAGTSAAGTRTRAVDAPVLASAQAEAVGPAARAEQHHGRAGAGRQSHRHPVEVPRPPAGFPAAGRTDDLWERVDQELESPGKRDTGALSWPAIVLPVVPAADLAEEEPGPAEAGRPDAPPAGSKAGIWGPGAGWQPPDIPDTAWPPPAAAFAEPPPPAVSDEAPAAAPEAEPPAAPARANGPGSPREPARPASPGAGRIAWDSPRVPVPEEAPEEKAAEPAAPDAEAASHFAEPEAAEPAPGASPGEPAAESAAAEDSAGEEPADKEPAGEEPAGGTGRPQWVIGGPRPKRSSADEPGPSGLPAGARPGAKADASGADAKGVASGADAESAGAESAGAESAGAESAGAESAGAESAGPAPDAGDAREKPRGQGATPAPGAQQPAVKTPAAEEPAAEEPAAEEPADEELAAGEPADEEPANAGAAAQPDPGRVEVTVVPGVARYHRSGCILIRFLGADDLEVMTRQEAEEAKFAACRACQPDQLEG